MRITPDFAEPEPTLREPSVGVMHPTPSALDDLVRGADVIAITEIGNRSGQIVYCKFGNLRLYEDLIRY